MTMTLLQDVPSFLRAVLPVVLHAINSTRCMSEELDLGSYMLHMSTFFKHLYACDSAYYYHMIYICMPEPSRNLGAGFRFRLTSDVFLHHLLGG